MAFHNSLRPAAVGICLLLAATAARADDKPKATALTPQEIADGWLLLFDGETTFGWKVDGGAVVKEGSLVLGGGKPTVATPQTGFASYDLRLETYGVGELVFAYEGGSSSLGLTNQSTRLDLKVRVGFGGSTSESTIRVGPDGSVSRTGSVETAKPATFRVEVPAGGTFAVRSAMVRPHGTRPLFNGKDLAGWKPFTGDPKRSISKFTVTPAGELSVKNGPGDLQTEKQFDDFVLQLECKTNGTALNSGIFFRCLPDQYQQGYEAQVQNGYLGGDRTKPADFGTGAIYRRVPARKVVSNDREWFTMTVLAKGPHIATWVNGYPVVSWADDRKPAENARQGLYTKKGPLSIQGHDPTTDLLFRNIRIADLK